MANCQLDDHVEALKLLAQTVLAIERSKKLRLVDNDASLDALCQEARALIRLESEPNSGASTN